MSYYTSDKKSPPRKIFRGGDFLFVNSREGGFPQGMNFTLVRWDISLTLNMTCFFILRHSERSEESHRRTDKAYTFSLWSWDISLTLNMTYFSLYVILNAVKNPTEELTSIYLFTLVVGYFAYAQYDVPSLLPPSGEVARSADRG